MDVLLIFSVVKYFLSYVAFAIEICINHPVHKSDASQTNLRIMPSTFDLIEALSK